MPDLISLPNLKMNFSIVNLMLYTKSIYPNQYVMIIAMDAYWNAPIRRRH
jgi:hypothetical protein